jgi:hypothetical protein
MFDQSPKPTIKQDFPVRGWLGVSCANPACPNYGKTDVRCPKAGKDKTTDRQLYKCKRCKRTFYQLDPPEGLFRIHRAPANEGVEAKPEENLKAKQPEPEQPLNDALESKAQAQPEQDLAGKQLEQKQTPNDALESKVQAQPEEGLETKQPEQKQTPNEASESKVQVQLEESLETKQPEQKQAERKKVSFLLTYQAVQGLHKVCASLGLETSELLEQIGQGTLEVQFARKEIKLSSVAINKSVT